MQPVFTIECKDIILREFQLKDLDDIYTLTLQPEIADYLPDWKATREQRMHWLTHYELKENQEFLEAASRKPVSTVDAEILRLGIILKETGEFIGWCCTGLKDELPPPNREIAYAISKDHRSKGYTTQAAQGLIKYLFEQTNVEELSAIALVHNIPSNRIIQKCDFHFISTFEIEGEKFHYYKLTKTEWEKKLCSFSYFLSSITNPALRKNKQ